MYFKVYGIFISLFSLCLTKWGREYFILFIFYQFINILFLDFFSYTSLWENHTFPSLFCSKKNKLLLYPCQFSIFCKRYFVFTLFVTFTKTSRKTLNAIYNHPPFFFSKDIKVNSISTCTNPYKYGLVLCRGLGVIKINIASQVIGVLIYLTLIKCLILLGVFILLGYTLIRVLFPFIAIYILWLKIKKTKT